MARRKKLEVVKEKPIEEVVGEPILHKNDTFTVENDNEGMSVKESEPTVSDEENSIEATEVASVGENIVEEFSEDVEKEILNEPIETAKEEEPKVTPKVSPYAKSLEIMRKASRKNKFANSIVAFMWNGQEFD